MGIAGHFVSVPPAPLSSIIVGDVCLRKTMTWLFFTALWIAMVERACEPRRVYLIIVGYCLFSRCYLRESLDREEIVM